VRWVETSTCRMGFDQPAEWSHPRLESASGTIGLGWRAPTSLESPRRIRHLSSRALPRLWRRAGRTPREPTSLDFIPHGRCDDTETGVRWGMTESLLPDPPLPAAASSAALASEVALRQLALTYATDTARRSSLSDDPVAGPTLDARTGAIVRVAALIALGASAPSYKWGIEAAYTAGVTTDEVLGILLAVAPRVGLARLVSAILPLALAVGYDIEDALESLDPPL
jgi:4-carboxymuconolactone decarboxylase